MKTLGDVVATPVEEDVPDTAVLATRVPSGSKEFGQKTLRSLKRGLGRIWRRHRGNASITEYDPSYKVAYLGNVLTGWAKGEGCVEKPVSTLWRNYVSSNRPDVTMRLTVINGGLTATTKDHGLTEYWAHRVTYCTAPASHPRLFVWVYRHEGRRSRPELRCHAALCSKESVAERLASTLNARLRQALLEFRRDKVSRQNARLSLANAVYEHPSLPRRKILLSTGGQNYRPPLERSKSAPKLSAIEEDSVAEEIEQRRLLEELKSFEKAARSWQDQEGWRLARLLDVALNRESADENISVSSGCETASTANSEERSSRTGVEARSSADGELPLEGNNSEDRDEDRLAADADGASGDCKSPGGAGGPRRNSEGSPHFMTCSGSPRFRERSHQKGQKLQLQQVTPGDGYYPSGSVFDFDDEDEIVDADDEDDDVCVDYKPRGESPRLENCSGGSVGVRIPKRFPLDLAMTRHDFLDETTSFLTLDSLDEEADSDESGYVEAPPKTLLLSQEEPSVKEKLEDVVHRNCRYQYLRSNSFPTRGIMHKESIDTVDSAVQEKSSEQKDPSTDAEKPSVDVVEESPCLRQRKQWLALRGVAI